MSTQAPTSGKTKTLPYDIFRFVTPPLQTPYGQGLAYISPEKIKSGIQWMAGLITDFLPNEATTPVGLFLPIPQKCTVTPSSPKHSKKRMWRLFTAMFVQRGGAAKLSFWGKLYAKDSLLISTFRSIARLASTTQPQKGIQRLLLLGASLYKHSCLKGTLSRGTSPTARGTALPIAFFLCTNIGVNFGHFSPRGGQRPEGNR
jgi:hypothetical protein